MEIGFLDGGCSWDF
jgi:hypothetical protein